MYDRHHYLVTIGGTAVTGLEEWQTGFRVAPSANHSLGELVTALGLIDVNDVLLAFRPIIENTDSFMAYHSSLKLTFAKVAIIKPDGNYGAAPKIAEGSFAGKTSVAQCPPPQLAWCVTLGTGHRFGMAQKGRMYWPVPHNIITSGAPTTGQIPQNYCDQMRTQVKTALEVAEGEVSTVLVGAGIAVMSKSGGVTNPTGEGVTNYVTEISVGRILDTQRRRRGELQEAYVPVPAARGTRETDFATPRGQGPA
jgi:hypothetical protein